MFYDNRQFYIDGAWVNPIEAKEFKVINPATETPAGVISMGSSADVDLAVGAARRAFDSYSRTPPAERLALMERWPPIRLATRRSHWPFPPRWARPSPSPEALRRA
jgi:acyl-CoA reductase-like NAD-dependent aldehyde dehydrogenase